MNYKEKARIFRERFYGRQDVYGPQWVSQDKEGNTFKGYNPACANLWADRCHIKLKDGVSCTKCEIKSFIPVSDESVLRHISGEEPQMHYVLQMDGTVRFAAFDFDYKPGKEDKGYTFEDVRKVVAVLKEWGMPYGIARSTGNGYHIYFFMDEFYSARKFRSVMYEIADRCGFMLESQNGIRPLLEMFPKQQYVADGGLGNGIKPPMIEANFGKERNCFVDDDGIMIPAAKQWEHLDGIERIKTKFLDDLIDKLNIPLEPEMTLTNKHHSAGPRRSSSGPVNGSIEKVVEGCAAFRSMRKKMESGYVPGHFEGTALWHVAINTLDGKEWFVNNVPGWGKDSQGMRQLEHGIDKGYTPWTCRKMQESGVCAVGTKCFEKKPPIEYVEGKPVVKTDVPESEWPEPSPIRYAFGKGEDFLQKLINEVDLILAVEDPAERAQRVRDIISRGSAFDATQQSVLKEHLVNSKVGKRSDLNKWMAEANSEREKKVTEASLERVDTYAIGGVVCRIVSPQGYSFLKPGGKKGEPTETVISNFFIDILEERTVIEGGSKRRTFFGKFTGRTIISDFEIDTDTWSDTGEFCKFFLKIGGSDFGVKKQDVDMLKQIVQHISQLGREGVPACKRTTFFGVQGWHDGAYVMPSTIVDKDGIRPNTEKPVDLNGKELASKIDFKLLTEGDFREVLFHIKNDLFKAFPRDCVMFGVGFSIIASVHDYLDLRSRPVLWVNGTTGHGKSTLVELLQCFYGDFRYFLSWQAKPTAKAVMDYMHQFKDAVFLADDFKGIDKQEDSALKTVVQSSYDGAVRSALDKSGRQRGDVMSRCLLMVSGEELPQNHASVIARTVTIQYEPLDRNETTPYLMKCQEYRHQYSGVTGRFVHWVLNQTRQVLQKEYADLFNDLMQPINGKQNASRIAKNISMISLGWNCFTRFMMDSGIIDAKEAKALIDEFKVYAERIRDEMIIRCKEEQSVNILISRTTELLMSGEIYIEGMEFDAESSRGIKVGFIDKKDAMPDTVYIWPDTLLSAVAKSMSGGLVISRHSAGAQFKENDFLQRTSGEGGTTIMKRYGPDKNTRVWALKLSKFGFDVKPSLVGKTEPMKLQPTQDAEGLI